MVRPFNSAHDPTSSFPSSASSNRILERLTLISTDCFPLVSGLRSCSSISCSHSSWLKKEPLSLEARSTDDSQLNAFFPPFGLGFNEERGHDLFFLFRRHSLISQDDNFESFQYSESHVFCETQIHMCLAVT